MNTVEECELKYSRLKRAVYTLYYSAHWSSDRLDQNEEALIWLEIKESAEFTEKAPNKIGG